MQLLFLVLASWLLGSAKFACLQRQKPATFAQMPLFVYRHFSGAVCTTLSDGRFMGMIAFTEFPTIAAGHRVSFSSRYIAYNLASKDLTLLFLLSHPSPIWSPAEKEGSKAGDGIWFRRSQKTVSILFRAELTARAHRREPLPE